MGLPYTQVFPPCQENKSGCPSLLFEENKPFLKSSISPMSVLSGKTLKLLEGAEARLSGMRGLVGLDGFVDQIIRVVDKIQADGSVTYIADMPALARRIHAAAGKSVKFDLSVQQTKLGGNGPIMANALAQYSLPITCLGNLSHNQELHPVFKPMESRCQVISMGETCYTDALEFNDGKIMLSRQEDTREITWDALKRAVGSRGLVQLFEQARFVALNNWTALPHMTAIWRRLQTEVCPRLSRMNRMLFIDLADPEFRLAKHVHGALKQISRFARWFDTTLGLNQKEAGEIGEVLGCKACPERSRRIGVDDRTFARTSAEMIRSKLKIQGVVVHATAFAAAASKTGSAFVEGPFVAQPLISTGAGDHFNAGYALAGILGGDLEQRLQLGVATSGYYVRTAKSPSLPDIRRFLKKIDQ